MEKRLHGKEGNCFAKRFQTTPSSGEDSAIKIRFNCTFRGRRRCGERKVWIYRGERVHCASGGEGTYWRRRTRGKMDIIGLDERRSPNLKVSSHRGRGRCSRHIGKKGARTRDHVHLGGEGKSLYSADYGFFTENKRMNK